MNEGKYKSSVFSMLLQEPKYALDVYNALNGSHYTDVNELQIINMESGVLLSIRNDSSFIVDAYLNMYEHQSTYNPNMPLRFLFYVSTAYKEYITWHKMDLYGSKKIHIPTPKFVVFYNGEATRPEREILNLSDMYEHKLDSYDLELACEVYNINPEYNMVIQRKSYVLQGYMEFVEKVRKWKDIGIELKQAITQAVDECIQENALAEFFQEKRAEVIDMALLDCTFEAREYMIRRDAREEGEINTICRLVKGGRITLADAAESLSISVEELQQRLLSTSQE